jgi:hypothetical protein
MRTLLLVDMLICKEIHGGTKVIFTNTKHTVSQIIWAGGMGELVGP